jgi:hypothetical protein
MSQQELAHIVSSTGTNLLKLATEIERLKIGHDRYEKVRRLNVHQFADLYTRNINGDARFDDLVDSLEVSE